MGRMGVVTGVVTCVTGPVPDTAVGFLTPACPVLALFITCCKRGERARNVTGLLGLLGYGGYRVVGVTGLWGL